MRFVVLAAVLFAAPAAALDVPIGGKLEQGGLAIGTAPPGSSITIGERSVPAAADGTFFVGLGRDAPASVDVKIVTPRGA